MGNLGRIFRSLREDSRLLVQALRYGAAAFLGFMADYAALLTLKEWCGLHYLVAVPIAFVAGVAINYLVGVTFVFRRESRALAGELMLFLLISLAALGLTEALMYMLTDLLSIDYRFSRIVTGAFTYLFNFLLRRRLYRTAGRLAKTGNEPDPAD